MTTPPAHTPPRRGRARIAVFWALLLALVTWDLLQSPAVDLRREPPLIAAGSGQAVSGGHCSMAK